MRIRTFRKTSILVMPLLLIALTLSGTAQQQRPVDRTAQEGQQQERQPIPELARPQEIRQVDMRVAVPKECKGQPEVQTHDVADKFKPPGVPLTLSPALTSFLQSHNLKPKGYDDNRVNMVFADSFRLRSCKICYATLELSVQHYGDIWQNDTITIGTAPFTPASNVFVYGNVWSPATNTPNPRPLSFVIPTTPLNQYIFNPNTTTPFLDVITQDDSDYDYARLSVWYY